VSGPVKFTTAGAATKATLSRRGKVFATGTAVRTVRGHLTLRLTPLRILPGGRYTLTITHKTRGKITASREGITIS
jgi:hypothetical protein